MRVSTGAPRFILHDSGTEIGRIRQLLGSLGWAEETVQTSRELLRWLRTSVEIDVVVLSPGSDCDEVAEICRSIKFDSRLKHYSVVVLLREDQAAWKVDLYESGADDCISGQMSEREIALRLEKAARLKHATDSMEDAGTIIAALANAVEGKDSYTCGHVDRVGMYAVEIGRRMGVDAGALAALKTGGLVHDIGKIGIPDHILNKPGKLTDEEMAIMRRHPIIGYDILFPLRTFKEVLPIVRWHHEKPNGTGYPDGLSDDQIPMLPKIVAAADVFDALSTDRPYRKAFSIDRCFCIIDEEVDKGNLDGQVVRALADSTGLHEAAASIAAAVAAACP